MSYYSEDNTINYIGFNQDMKFIVVGHKDGYMFYKTSEILEKSVLTYAGERKDQSTTSLTNVLLADRLFSSSLMAVVTEKDPRVLHLYNFREKIVIVDHRMSESILAVKINRERIAVCLENGIYIYSLKEAKVLHTIMGTQQNKFGLIDMTTEKGTAMIAYPGNFSTGSISLFDAITMSHINSFVAHEGTIACLKFNQEGTMLATASTKGTVIRVFSVPSGNTLFEFRRGVSRCVTIFSLCFSADSKYLSSSSNTETVHIFKLDEEKQNVATPSTGWFDSINKTISAYMPIQILQVGELITTERSFATAKLPGPTKSNKVSLITHKNEQYVVAATSDGFVYAYRLDSEGGELELIKQHRIGPRTDSHRISPSQSDSSDSELAPTQLPTSMFSNLGDADDCPPTNHASG